MLSRVLTKVIFQKEAMVAQLMYFNYIKNKKMLIQATKRPKRMMLNKNPSCKKMAGVLLSLTYRSIQFYFSYL